jgi:hypothetical protein
MTIKPELPLIEQLNAARAALQDERTSLLERVAVIDQALGASPSKGAPRAAKGVHTVNTPKPPKGGTKEAVLTALAAPATLKEIVAALPQFPSKSLESTVYALAKEGAISKDGSKPSRFSVAKSVGATA